MKKNNMLSLTMVIFLVTVLLFSMGSSADARMGVKLPDRNPQKITKPLDPNIKLTQPLDKNVFLTQPLDKRGFEESLGNHEAVTQPDEDYFMKMYLNSRNKRAFQPQPEPPGKLGVQQLGNQITPPGDEQMATPMPEPPAGHGLVK
jgi:hypothetical protein